MVSGVARWPWLQGALAVDSSPEYVRVTSVLTFSGELPSPWRLPKAVQTCLIRHDKTASARLAPEVPGELRMAIMMPASDQAVLSRREAIVAALRAIVSGEGVIDSAAE